MLVSVYVSVFGHVFVCVCIYVFAFVFFVSVIGITPPALVLLFQSLKNAAA